MEPVPEFICKVCGSTMLPHEAYQVWNREHSHTGLENKALYLEVQAVLAD